MKNKTNFLIFALTLLSGLVKAQEEIVSIKFSLLGWKETIRDLYYYSGEEDNPVFVATGAPSDYYQYTGTLPVRFYKVSVNEENGSVARDQVLTVNVNPDVEEWLFLVLGEQRKNSLKILPIPDNDQGAKNNSFLIYNLSSGDAALEIDKQLKQVRRGQNEVIQLATESGKNIPVHIASFSDDNGWEVTYSSRWGHLNSRRAWIFIVDGKNGDLDLKRFYRAPKK